MAEKWIPFLKDAGLKSNEVGLALKASDGNGMPATEMMITETLGEGECVGELCCCDCLSACGWLAEQGRIVDLVYIDPPFGSGSDYNGKVFLRGYDQRSEAITRLNYRDKLKKDAYLVWLRDQLRAIRTIMSDHGTIYLHLDWHIAHYAKVLMDEVFGSKNYLNEIVWAYKSGGATKDRFSRKHDTILVYAKDKGKHCFHTMKEKSYNRDYKPYRFQGVEEFQDEKGWYTLVNMKDVWEIDMVGRTSKERVDYATQKPEALLERMILASSDPGMVVADFFGGSGVAAMVAMKLKRRFIHCDINPESIITARDRLMKYSAKIEIRSLKKDREKSDDNDLTVRVIEKDHEWFVSVEYYEGREIRSFVKKAQDEKGFSVEISERGLEMINYISVDCHTDEGPWQSTNEIYINKKGHVIQNNIELNMMWNGIINSTEPPKRIRIRDIFGNELIKLLTKT